MKLSLVNYALIPSLFLSAIALAGEKIDKSISVPMDGKIIIENDRGDVEIRAWEKAEFKVTGELDDLAKGYRLETVGNVTEFIVDLPRNRNWNNEGEGSQLVIYLPAKSVLNFEGVNVNVSVRDMLNNTRVKTVNGDVNAQQLKGILHLATVNGGVKTQNLDGEIHLETVNGDIRDTASKGTLRFNAVNGDIKSETQAHTIKFENVNGDVEFKIASLKELDFNTVNGEAQIYVDALEKGGRINMNSVSGDIDLYLPKAVSANFDIQTHSGGSIRNGFNDEKATKAKYTSARRLKFISNGGNADVEIDTVSGNISLKQR
ncbi:hypothetical protein PALB_24330 [Pseudoalteromonas luteoviolacea B = ATCC 29581]|nr:hypothetical protein PALB_24330 [Pseudoalteromonas luteoviolacea B = ATCC 29581]